MSFIDLSTSTTQQNPNNQMNYNSASSSFSRIIVDKPDNSFELNKFRKCQKSTLNDGPDTPQIDMCFDYDKCFANTFDYDANNFDYDARNSFELNTTATQSCSNAMQFAQHFDGVASEVPKEIGKFKCIYFLTALCGLVLCNIQN